MYPDSEHKKIYVENDKTGSKSLYIGGYYSFFC